MAISYRLYGLIGLMAAACIGQGASAQTPFRVINFPGVQELPIFAAEDQGFFKKRGLDVIVTNTGSSTELRDGLASGKYDIAHTASDNAVAMVELAHADTVIVMGGDNSFNHLFVTPDIKGWADLKGKTATVDAPNTAFALVLYRMLEQHGVKRSDYKVSLEGGTPVKRLAGLRNGTAQMGMLNLPFLILAQRAGLKDMGSLTDAIGPYQGTAGFVMRPWAKAHPDAVIHYIQGYVDGLRWAEDPKHKQAAIDLLIKNLKLDPAIAARAYDIATAPRSGFAKDAKLDRAGFRNVLKLRAEVEGQWGGKAPPAKNYVDLSYYRQALGHM